MSSKENIVGLIRTAVNHIQAAGCSIWVMADIDQQTLAGDPAPSDLYRLLVASSGVGPSSWCMRAVPVHCELCDIWCAINAVSDLVQP